MLPLLSMSLFLLLAGPQGQGAAHAEHDDQQQDGRGRPHHHPDHNLQHAFVICCQGEIQGCDWLLTVTPSTSCTSTPSLAAPSSRLVQQYWNRSRSSQEIWWNWDIDLWQDTKFWRAPSLYILNAPLPLIVCTVLELMGLFRMNLRKTNTRLVQSCF